MDEQSNYIPVKTKGSILNIKPIEELEKVEPKPEPEHELEPEPEPEQVYDNMEPEIEDLKKDEIFMKPEKPKKKKRVLSERQKAHMARLNQLRIERLAKKKKEKEAKEAKKKPKPVKPIQKPTPKPIQKISPQATPGEIPKFDLNEANQAYMKQFFNNMNMFMESYNKLNSIKQKQQPPATPVQTVRKTIKKPVQKPARVPQPNFRTPVVPHYKNPWGIYDP